jgi:hypothetical protein
MSIKITKIPVENWDLQKEKLKQKIALLTDPNMLLLEERMNDVGNRLEIKLGKTKEEVQKLISNL